MKKAYFLAAFFLLAFLLSGCKGSGEVQRRLVVHAIGVDPADEGFTVSYQVFAGRADESGPTDADESTVVTLLAAGRTLGEAEENLRLKTGKEVFLGDCELILISDKLREIGLMGFLDYLKSSDVYSGVSVAYCRGSASETVSAKLKQGSATAILLRGVLEEAIMCGRALSSRVIELTNALEFDGESAAVPVLEMTLGRDNGDGSTLTETDIGVYHSIIMTPNGCGPETDSDSAAGISLLKGSTRALEFLVESKNGSADIRLDKVRSSRKIRIENGMPVIDINISGRYTVRASTGDMSDDEIKKLSEKALLELCSSGYEYISSGDLFEIKKMMIKYEGDYFRSKKDSIGEIIPKTTFNVRASLFKY